MCMSIKLYLNIPAGIVLGLQPVDLQKVTDEEQGSIGCEAEEGA